MKFAHPLSGHSHCAALFLSLLGQSAGMSR